MDYYYVDAKQLKALLKLEKIASVAQFVLPILLIVLLNIVFNSGFSWLIFLLPMLMQFSVNIPLAGADKKYLYAELIKVSEESAIGEGINLDLKSLLSVEALDNPIDFGIVGNLFLKRYYPEQMLIAATTYSGTRTEIDVTLLKHEDRLHLLDRLVQHVTLNRETSNERS